jgi:hypothetical protein
MASVNAGQAPSVISRLALMVVAVIVSRCSGIGFVDQASLQISITATKTKGRSVLRSPSFPRFPASRALGILGLEFCVALHFDAKVLCRRLPEKEHGLLIFRGVKISSSDFRSHFGEGYTYMTQCKYM